MKCPDCGGENCRKLFHRLIEHAAEAPWQPLHPVATSCYFLQHGNGSTQQLQLVDVFLDEGLDGVYAAARKGVRPEPEHMVYADGFASSIQDVSVDGTFPADGYEDRVRRWATDTLARFSDAGQS